MGSTREVVQLLTKAVRIKRQMFSMLYKTLTETIRTKNPLTKKKNTVKLNRFTPRNTKAEKNGLSMFASLKIDRSRKANATFH